MFSLRFWTEVGEVNRMRSKVWINILNIIISQLLLLAQSFLWIIYIQVKSFSIKNGKQNIKISADTRDRGISSEAYRV